METDEGKRLMDQRSILSEGAFGNLKETGDIPNYVEEEKAV